MRWKEKKKIEKSKNEIIVSGSQLFKKIMLTMKGWTQIKEQERQFIYIHSLTELASKQIYSRENKLAI